MTLLSSSKLIRLAELSRVVLYLKSLGKAGFWEISRRSKYEGKIQIASNEEESKKLSGSNIIVSLSAHRGVSSHLA